MHTVVPLHVTASVGFVDAWTGPDRGEEPPQKQAVTAT